MGRAARRRRAPDPGTRVAERGAGSAPPVLESPGSTREDRPCSADEAPVDRMGRCDRDGTTMRQRPPMREMMRAFHASAPQPGRSPVPDRRHTTIDVDTDLLAAAAAVLGTTRTTETIHAALREVVAHGLRVRLAARDFSLLTEHLGEVRAVKTADEA